MINKKKKLSIGVFLLMVVLLVLISFNSRTIAQTNNEVGGGEIVSINEATVCCEKTKSGLFCQDVPQEQCADGASAIPTSCDATAMCRSGWCFDSVEGTCLDGVANSVCGDNGGTWYEQQPPACELGCCFLGDEAAFVTLTRCKALSAGYGIETNFNGEFSDELSCIQAASAQEKGACVFVKDFQRTCELTTRGECTVGNMYGSGTAQESTTSESGSEFSNLVPAPATSQNTQTNASPQLSPENGTAVTGFENESVRFFAGKLCSAPELQTNCGVSRDTICVEGKQEVYFLDTCGNPANIYDASKVNDLSYWSNIVSKEDSCGPSATDGNVNNQQCGNCLYLAGSYCREKSSITATATYGDNICASLNCKDVDGKERLHGESWCGADVKFEDIGRNAVGSKYYRYQCNNGEIVVEPCSEFRQEECIENSLETPLGEFSEAACRVNRWQDCNAQRDAATCLNTDRRDCLWLDGIEYILMGAVVNGGGENSSSSIAGEGSLAGIGKRARQTVQDAGGLQNIPRGACVPKNPPGLNFWSEGEAQTICQQANAVCPVTYQKGLVGGDWECVENCECLPGGELEIKRAQLCVAMGDCGPNVNIEGQFGNNKGYKVTERELGED